MGALVLGVDTPIGLTVVRELGRAGVPVHAVGRSPRAIGLASRHVATRHVRGQGPLASWLPGLIAETGARALFAISEGDLIELADMPPAIAGCRVLTPRAEQLALALDKRATLALAAGIGIDVPQSWQPASSAEAHGAARDLRFPLVLKWSDPNNIAAALDHAGIELRKAEIVRTPSDLAAALRRYDPLGRWPLVQEYCPGRGIGQMLYMRGGRATLRFQHERLHEWPPEGGVSSLCRAVPLSLHRTQMERSEALMAAMDWSGPAMVEYRWDPATDTFRLMEVNGRFWGSLPLASACGARFAWEGWRREVLGDDSPVPAPRDGRTARYLVPELRRLARVLGNANAITDPQFHPTPLRDLADFTWRTLNPRTVHYVWQWRDPGPMLRDLGSIAGKIRPGAAPRSARPRTA